MCKQRKYKTRDDGILGRLISLKDLILRKQLDGSELLKAKWKNYEKILMYRTNCAVISNLIADAFHIYSGVHFY